MMLTEQEIVRKWHGRFLGNDTGWTLVMFTGFTLVGLLNCLEESLKDSANQADP